MAEEEEDGSVLFPQRGQDRRKTGKIQTPEDLDMIEGKEETE